MIKERIKEDKSKKRYEKLKSDEAKSIDINEDCYESYFEKTISFEGDAVFLISQIIEFCEFGKYFLYEKEKEISLALGIHTLLFVDSEYATLIVDKELSKFKNEVLSETIDKALSLIKIKNWRAYGIANYGLARYNYKLSLFPENNELIKLFIPRIELRFSKNLILLRAIDKKELEFIEKSIRSVLLDEEHKNNLKKRVDAQKLEALEIYSYDQEKYITIAEKAIKDIKERKYQKVVLSRKISLKHELDMVASYIAGRKVTSFSRSYFFSIDGLDVAGLSPETVFEVDCDGWISTFPLAGTRSTGSSGEERKQLKKELLDDTKEILEHLGAVRFAYEEVKRICDPKTVSISDFMSVVERGTVQHISSRVRGKLKQGYNPWCAFNALFPAVTSSGIPKREAIDKIGELEKEPRNLYGGCVFIYDSNGVMDSALVLRTIFQKDHTSWLQVGAGIGEMSVPRREFQETCEKISSVSRQLVPKKA